MQCLTLFVQFSHYTLHCEQSPIIVNRTFPNYKKIYTPISPQTSPWAYNWILDICHFLNFKTAPWAYKKISPIRHVYMAVGRSPLIGESLNTQVEPDNVHDKYAVKVLKEEAVVDHVPREILRYCSFVLNSAETMSGTVTGAREKRRGNWLTAPYKYKLKGPKTFLLKAEYIQLEILLVERQTNL